MSAGDAVLIDITGVAVSRPLAVSIEENIGIPEGYGLFIPEVSVVFNGCVSKRNAKYFLEGKLSAVLPAVCALCLRDVSHAIELDVCEVFSDAGGSQSLNEEEWPVDGGSIDVYPVLESILLTSIPLKLVCREDCAGLCPKCGKNLNNGPCGCADEKNDERFEVLKNWRCNDGSNLS